MSSALAYPSSPLDYAGDIERLLGNQGASLTLGGTGSAPIATFSGGPSGSSTDVEPSAAAISAVAALRNRSGVNSGYANQPAAILSLSANARHVLSQDEIALNVLTGKQGVTVPPIEIPSTPSQATSGAHSYGPASAAQISAVLAQAHADVSDPNFFYRDANANNYYLGLGLALSGDQRTSFLQAFNNHTLQIRNAADIKGLDYVDQTPHESPHLK